MLTAFAAASVEFCCQESQCLLQVFTVCCLGPVAGTPDLEKLTCKLERRKCSLSDLCQLYRASSKLPTIQKSCSSRHVFVRHSMHVAAYVCTYAGMPDVERLMRKLERHKCSLSDLCQLCRAAANCP